MSSFISTPRHNSASVGLKRQELFQSQLPEVRRTYDDVLRRDHDSLTTVRDNDAASKFRVAYATLPTTRAQRISLEAMERAFRRIEFQIDPQRLTFTFGQTPDDDIVINHSHSDGISTLVLHDDGSVALSFIARRHVAKPDQLGFHEAATADWEGLALRFLIGQ